MNIMVYQHFIKIIIIFAFNEIMYNQIRPKRNENVFSHKNVLPLPVSNIVYIYICIYMHFLKKTYFFLIYFMLEVK